MKEQLSEFHIIVHDAFGLIMSNHSKTQKRVNSKVTFLKNFYPVKEVLVCARESQFSIELVANLLIRIYKLCSFHLIHKKSNRMRQNING